MRFSLLANAIVGVMVACATALAESITVNPQVTGKGVVLGGGTVESGTEMTLRAVAEVDWRFDHWEGVPGGQSQGNPITLTVVAGVQPRAVLISSDGAGHFAGAPVVLFFPRNETPAIGNVPAGLNAITVSAGGANALALKPDGTVTYWDVSKPGELAVPAGLSNVVSIYSGTGHQLAVREDGTVAAWGGNSAAQTNLPPGLSNVVAVAAGSFHSVALRNDGTVVAWGSNDFGQTNVPAGLRNVIAIGASERYSLAVKGDGTVVGWGRLLSGSGDLIAPTPPPYFTNMVSIDADSNYNLGINAEGRVKEWGYLDGLPGGLRDGISNVVSAGAGQSLALAVTLDQTMYPWGRQQLDPDFDPVPNIIAAEPANSALVAIQGEGFGFIRSARTSFFVEEGEPVRMAPVTTGGESFQWFRNGQGIAGETARYLIINSATAGDAGSYSLAVISGTNAVATPPAVVTVAPAGYPRVLVNGMEVRDTARLSGSAQVTLTTTLADAQIFYTVDGSTPTFSSTRYTAPFALNQTTNVTIRALAISGDFTKQATNAPVRIDVAPSYTLTVTVSGPGRVDVTPKLTVYLQGDVVRLEAIPNANATFVGWANMLSGTEPVKQMVMNENWTVEAVFQDAPRYAATILNPGGGTVTMNPPGPQYVGTDVTITATPNEGWEFQSWTGDHVGTSNRFGWHVEGPATFKANFGTAITTIATGPGHIDLEPELPLYLNGTEVRVIPVPEVGNEFVLWGLDAAGKPTGEFTLTVTNAQPQLSALFQATSPPAYEVSEVRIENGQLTLVVRGSAGTTVTVQATEDFVTWMDVKTMTMGTSGVSVESVGAIAAGDAEWFYRIKQAQ
jgi:hypothetical protein